MQINLLRFAFLATLIGAVNQVNVAWSADNVAVEQVKTLQIVASGSRYEPLQYITPYMPSRHVSDYTLTTTWDPTGYRARENWNLHTIYPFPAKLSFWAIYHRQQGQRKGRDGFRPSAEGPVQPARVGAVFKDLWLSNPTILLAYAKALPSSEIEQGGIIYRRRLLSYQGSEWVILVNQTTGLPAEISTLEVDPLEGEVRNRIAFSDWREVAGIAFPFKLEQYVGDRIIRRETRQSVTINPQNIGKSLELTAGKEVVIDKDLRQWGWSMSNFFLRRMAMGAPSDKDQSKVVKFSEVGKGIYQILGSSHNNLLVVGTDGLAIVDAVWYPRRSNAILREIHKRWPDKALKYVILSHHHMDHTGGLMPYVKAGAVVVTSKNNERYFRRILDKTNAQASMLTVNGGHTTLNGIGRSVEVYHVYNSHAAGFLAVFVPDEKLMFNTDLYSPGRPTQQKTWAKELLDAIEFYGIDVKTHVGGHGMGTKPQQDLVDLVGSN